MKRKQVVNNIELYKQLSLSKKILLFVELLERQQYFKITEMLKNMIDEQLLVDKLLYRAVSYDEPKFLNSIINAGVNINLYNKDNTLLTTAVKKGHLECVNILIEAGINLSVIDRSGNTALCYAIYDNQIETINLLIEKGADVNQVNDSKRTPLHKATCCGNSIVSTILIEAGADLNLIDNYGYKPIDYAKAFDHLDCIKTIENITKIEQNNFLIALIIENNHLKIQGHVNNADVDKSNIFNDDYYYNINSLLDCFKENYY